MMIGFTCNVCSTRTHKFMSKTAYKTGIVLIQCPGCKNRHLIADNLGWFNSQPTTIEDIMDQQGDSVRKHDLSAGVAIDGGDGVSIKEQRERLLASFTASDDACLEFLPDDLGAWEQQQRQQARAKAGTDSTKTNK